MFHHISPCDIVQGRLKVSYLLTTLAAISEDPKRIKKMFITSEVNREGVFGITCYKNGTKQQVVVDNYFPCRTQKPVFSRSKCKELWVMILEKCWAKLHGSYDKIFQGQAYEVFRDLLGAPSYYHKTNEDNIWDILIDANDHKYITVATAYPNQFETQQQESTGIIVLQNLCVKQICYVQSSEGEIVPLIQLRNSSGRE